MEKHIDIRDRQDIERVLEVFYRRLLKDELVGHFFTEVVKLDLPSHLPRIAGFWESVLFGTIGYDGNLIRLHAPVHELSPIGKVHFDRWIAVFSQTVDELYSGQMADEMKKRAVSIAGIMYLKLHQNQTGKT
ncbi:MAG TPA: group III truncated hemoglobin [Flavisolibacter sp.]|nr:group III truncated hemoglobin [Flavisolibacter sp.]